MTEAPPLGWCVAGGMRLAKRPKPSLTVSEGALRHATVPVVSLEMLPVITPAAAGKDGDTVQVLLLWPRATDSRVLLKQSTGATGTTMAAFSAVLDPALDEGAKMSAIRELVVSVLSPATEANAFPRPVVSLSNAAGVFYVIAASDGKQADQWRLRLTTSVFDAQLLGHTQLDMLEADDGYSSPLLSHPALLAFAKFTLDRVRHVAEFQPVAGEGQRVGLWSPPSFSWNGISFCH